MCVFFKQKQAYEMRISDWSSYVCSSDLLGGRADPPEVRRARAIQVRQRDYDDPSDAPARHVDHPRQRKRQVEPPQAHSQHRAGHHGIRSEEHTSELQSLMRISYAVFCLKKKKNT